MRLNYFLHNISKGEILHASIINHSVKNKIHVHEFLISTSVVRSGLDPYVTFSTFHARSILANSGYEFVKVFYLLNLIFGRILVRHYKSFIAWTDFRRSSTLLRSLYLISNARYYWLLSYVYVTSINIYKCISIAGFYITWNNQFSNYAIFN